MGPFNTRYSLNQIVKVQYKSFKPSEIVISIIDAVRVYQSRHYRPECFSVDYLCSPLEMKGFEHDDNEWIPECHVECIPRIIGI